MDKILPKTANSIMIILLLYFPFAAANECQMSYRVVKASINSINIDGLDDEEAWENANVISDFISPWSKQAAPLTRFMALHDDSNLYMHFTSNDSTIVVEKNWRGEKTVANEDRIEFFFSQELNLNSYFAVEIDAYGRVLDYQAEFYRKFDRKWTLKNLRVSATITAQGYSVEVAVPLKSLERLLSLEKRFFVGLFRADLQRKSGKLSADWISWLDPSTTTPEFHVSSAFGCFYFP